MMRFSSFHSCRLASTMSRTKSFLAATKSLKKPRDLFLLLGASPQPTAVSADVFLGKHKLTYSVVHLCIITSLV